MVESVNTEEVRKQFLNMLNNPSLKEYYLAKGYVTDIMYNMFISKFGYKNGIFFTETFSNDKKLEQSLVKDERYGDYCFRKLQNKGKDIVFLSSIYNIFFAENSKQKAKSIEDEIIFIDNELRLCEKKLTNGTFMKLSHINLLEKEINKWEDLKERWKRIQQEV